MKKIFLVFMLAVSMAMHAQVLKVSLQASGLTCSMCSNSINKALRSLDFVLGVEPDLKTYPFEISFRENSLIDFDQIRRKVEAAGFFVARFIATIHFNNVEVSAAKPVVIGGKTLLFNTATNRLLNGPQQIRILDKGFVSAKEYRQNNFPVNTPGTYHVTI